MIFLWILIAIIMFSTIVIIHEFWHFAAARKFWVKVEEFWLWIPPKAKELFTDKKWTKYTLNWLPLWGFVRLKWENPAALEDKDDTEALSNKSYFAQSVIILWWVFMNFLLAIVIFSVLFFIWVKPITINSQIETNLSSKIIPTEIEALESWLLQQWEWVILYPVKDSIVQKAWINEWDILLKINWEKVGSPEEVIKIISEHKNKQLILNTKIDTKCSDTKNCVFPDITDFTINITPNLEWKIWSYISPNISINEDFEYKYWVIDSIKYWSIETYTQSVLTIKWLWIIAKSIISPNTPQERTEAISNMKWPIWIWDLIATTFERGVAFMMILAAIISISLWVFNLLPIPALDWWRFLFITINSLISKIFWKKALTQNIENVIHIFFFIVLIALSILIWYNDIINIISR